MLSSYNTKIKHGLMYGQFDVAVTYNKINIQLFNIIMFLYNFKIYSCRF